MSKDERGSGSGHLETGYKLITQFISCATDLDMSQKCSPVMASKIKFKGQWHLFAVRAKCGERDPHHFL